MSILHWVYTSSEGKGPKTGPVIWLSGWRATVVGGILVFRGNFLAVQDSSIGDVVSQSVSESVSDTL